MENINFWATGITILLLLAMWAWAELTAVRPFVIDGWQKPTMAPNGLRRAFGFIPGLMIHLIASDGNPTVLQFFFSTCFTIIAYVYLNPGNFFFPSDSTYIKWYRIMSWSGGARQVMSFKGEAGWQPGKKLKGMRWVPVAWNHVGYFNFTRVPSDAVWYLRSRVGGLLPAGRKTARVMPKKYLPPDGATVEQTFFFENPRAFMVAGGQLNIQRSFLTPGYVGPIDLIAFQVDDGTLPDSAEDKTYYKPFRVPNDKFGMVACLDSEHQMPPGAMFARLGGFDDIAKVIVKYFDYAEADMPPVTDQEQTRAKNAPKEVKDKPESIKSYDDVFRFDRLQERQCAGECLNLLLEGPPADVNDYQDVAAFDDLKGTYGPHWRLIRPGRLLNLNRFVFDITLVEGKKVEEGTAEVMILSSGVLARDITQRGFSGGRIVRVGGNGINLKALEPAPTYPIPYNPPSPTGTNNGYQRVTNLVDFVQLPTRQIALYFGKKTRSNFDSDLESIIESTKDGVKVTYDFNLIMSMPAEAGALIVAAYGNPHDFIMQVVASILVGVTVEFIRTHTIREIVRNQEKMLADIKSALENAVSTLYGVQINQVKMEHFEAEGYLSIVERQVTARAEADAFKAETKAQVENQALQTARGKAEADFKIAGAVGEAEALKKVLGATVEVLGKQGTVVLEGVKRMTSGKHPGMPATYGVAQGGDGKAGQGLIPALAMINAAINQGVIDEPEAKPVPDPAPAVEAEAKTEKTT